MRLPDAGHASPRTFAGRAEVGRKRGPAGAPGVLAVRLFLMLSVAALLLAGGIAGMLRGFGQYRGRVGLAFPLIIAAGCVLVAMVTYLMIQVMSGGL